MQPDGTVQEVLTGVNGDTVKITLTPTPESEVPVTLSNLNFEVCEKFPGNLEACFLLDFTIN